MRSRSAQTSLGKISPPGIFRNFTNFRSRKPLIPLVRILNKNHNTKPVLISCAYVKTVLSWGILKELRLYTSISLYRAFPSTLLSKVGLPRGISFIAAKPNLSLGSIKHNLSKSFTSILGLPLSIL